MFKHTTIRVKPLPVQIIYFGKFSTMILFSFLDLTFYAKVLTSFTGTWFHS